MQQITIRTLSGETIIIQRPADQVTRLTQYLRDGAPDGEFGMGGPWVDLLLSDGRTKQLRIAAIESVTIGAESQNHSPWDYAISSEYAARRMALQAARGA